MKKRCFLLIVVLLSSLLLVYGCGDDDGGLDQTPEKLIEQGWAKFAAGDDAGACADFKAAIGLSADTNEAYLGLGWAELRQDHAGLAQEAFETYLAKVSDSDEAKAGLALAYHAQDKLDDAIDMAEDVLSSDPSWSFSPHAPSINYLDLALILAESYYETADFSQSLLVVQQYFDPNFVVDPNTPKGRADLAKKLYSLYTG